MLRVAICDDDLKFTGEIETLVFQESRKLGIRVETEVFSDGKTLLNSIQNGEHYQLIFIDIEMEQVDGITAARCIREIDRTVLLIYVSGYDNYLKELFEVEPFRFLSKPLDHVQFARYFKESCKRINETEVFYQFTFNKEIRKVPVNYDYVKKMNFSNITISFMGKEIELKISEDRQKDVRQQLCKIAGGKAVIEE